MSSLLTRLGDALGSLTISNRVLRIAIAAVTIFVLISTVALTTQIPYSVIHEFSRFPSMSVGKTETALPEPDIEDLSLPANFEPEETSCRELRNYYDHQLQLRGASSSLKFDESGSIADEPWQLSKSQALFDSGCWTSQDRYRLYGSVINAQVNSCNQVEGLMNRTAFVLRVTPDHIFTTDALLSLRALVVEVGWHHKADIVLLQNIETHAGHGRDNPVPAEFDALAMTYKSDDIFGDYPEAKGNENRFGLNYENWRGKYTQKYYQYVQAWFFEQRPEYEFAYFVDTHVRSLSSWNQIFSAIQVALEGQPQPDLLTLAPIMVTKPNAWPPERQGPPENAYKVNLAVHGISRRLGAAIRTHINDRIVAPLDVFLPSITIQYQYNIAMFAHPLIKPDNGLLFHPYLVPTGSGFNVLNLQSGPSPDIPKEGNTTIWQSSASFSETRNMWVDGIYQSWRKTKNKCLPGLLIYPVSGE